MPYFTFSDRKRSARNKKYYPIDTGLRSMAVTYWRGHGEVDFVVTTDRGITPIQVSWERSADRHHGALAELAPAL